MQLDDRARGFSFQADGPSTADGPACGANRRTSGKPPRRASAADVIYEFGEEGGRGESPEPFAGRGRYDLPHILRMSYQPRPGQ